jgi:hypothetical protein
LAIEAFKQRILTDLLPQFCDDPSRLFGLEGFKADWSKITDVDAADFLRGLDAELVQHIGRGQYIAPRSAAKEQFFWEGDKKTLPRPITLWLEPIITVAGIARLHFDSGWPVALIGAQTRDWAFDFAAYGDGSDGTERIACEVKKSVKELTALVDTMKQFAAEGVASEVGLSKHQLNAFRKLEALRKREIPIFWALGPGKVSQCFEMAYNLDGKVVFSHCEENALSYRFGSA